MASASLLVKISADINDFSKKMSAMTRDVDRAAKKIESIGKTMTLGITLPVGLAGAALAKMALENDRTAARMKGSFGGAVDAMEAKIKQLQNVVPVAGTELEQMAISVNNLGKGLGLAAPAAADLAGEMLTMAGDLAAKNGVEMADALGALMKGLEGSTRGLKEMGIVLNDAQIKQEAYRLGLLHTGEELTPLGNAMAIHSLLVKKSGDFAGESARQHDSAAMKMQMFKTAASELADRLSNLLLPALTSLAEKGTALVDILGKVPDPVWKVVGGLAALAATVGPILWGTAKLASSFAGLGAVVKLVSGEGALFKVLGFLSKGTVIGGIITAASAVGMLATAFFKLKDASKGSGDALANDPALAAFIAKTAPATLTANKGEKFAINPKSDAEQLREKAEAVSSAFDSSVAHGQNLADVLSQANSAHSEALRLLDAQGSAFTRDAQTARDVADQMQRIADIVKMSNMTPEQAKQFLQTVQNRPYDGSAGAAGEQYDAARQYGENLAKRTAASNVVMPFDVNKEAELKMREDATSAARDLQLRAALLELPDSFDAASTAAVEYGEELRNQARNTGVQFEKLKMGLSGFGIHLGNLSNSMQQVVVTMFDAAMNFAQGLAQQLAGKGKGAGIGGGIGSLVGSIIGNIVAPGPIGTAIGSTLGSIGGALIGHIFDGPGEEAAQSLDTLSSSARRAADALLNIPTGFRVALAQYRASPIMADGSAWYPGPSSSGGNDGDQTIVIQLDGKVIAQSTLKRFKDQAARKYGDPMRWSEVPAL